MPSQVKLRRSQKLPETPYTRQNFNSGKLGRLALVFIFGAGVFSLLFQWIGENATTKLTQQRARYEATNNALGLRLVRLDDSAQYLANMKFGSNVRISNRLENTLDRNALRMNSMDATKYLLRARDDRVSLSEYHRFTPVHFNQVERHAAEKRCLAQAIYYEARSESFSGQLAVAEVVANRVIDKRFPNSFCRVVYQGSHRQTGCQFSFTCDGSLRKTPSGQSWAKAKELAAQVMIGFHTPITRGATHYHTTSINPYWAPSLVRTRNIGSHIFYRFPGGMETKTSLASAKAAKANIKKVGIYSPGRPVKYTKVSRNGRPIGSRSASADS